MTAQDTERDYSGVPTSELIGVYEKYSDCDIATFSERTGINERDLKKYVITPSYTFTGLRVADIIVTSLGQNLSHLIEMGELHLVPAARGKDSGDAAARMIVEDEYWTLDLEPPSEEEMQERISELLELRRTLCVPSEGQRERLRRDSERAQARTARLREG